MKKLLTLALVVTSLFAFTATAFADTYVDGYHRSDGTYVRGHWRSDPDGNTNNNWSHHGNRNPHTGEWGHRYD